MGLGGDSRGGWLQQGGGVCKTCCAELAHPTVRVYNGLFELWIVNFELREIYGNSGTEDGDW